MAARGILHEDIKVEVGYKDFLFTSINDAISFARMAAESLVVDRDYGTDNKVELSITFKRIDELDIDADPDEKYEEDEE